MKIVSVQHQHSFWSNGGIGFPGAVPGTTLLNSARHFIESRRPDILLFPEMSYWGYSWASRDEIAPHTVDAHDPPTWWRALESLASQSECAIVFGFPEVQYNRFFNSQAAIVPGSSASVITYSKINRWGNDFLWADAGQARPPIFSWKGKRCGLLVCRDVRDEGPRMHELYEPGETDLVLFSSAWGKGGFPAVPWIDFAIQNRTTLIVSNRSGVERGGLNDFGTGGICSVSPDGTVTTPPNWVNSLNTVLEVEV